MPNTRLFFALGSYLSPTIAGLDTVVMRASRECSKGRRVSSRGVVGDSTKSFKVVTASFGTRLGVGLFLELNSDLDIAPLHLGLASYVVPVLKSCEAYKVRA
jgi:hypothetical protein